MLRNVALLAKSFSASSKFIEVKPYPWLDFLEKSSKKLAPILDKGLNSPLQGRIGAKKRLILHLAGPAGFEPANAGTKTQCLTAWRRSNLQLF